METKLEDHKMEFINEQLQQIADRQKAEKVLLNSGNYMRVFKNKPDGKMDERTKEVMNTIAGFDIGENKEYAIELSLKMLREEYDLPKMLAEFMVQDKFVINKMVVNKRPKNFNDNDEYADLPY